MKKTAKIFSLTLIIMLFVSIISFFITGQTNAFAENYEKNDLEAFLDFEQEIINLNKDFFDNECVTKDEGIQNSSSIDGVESERVEISGEFALKRLIVQGNLKDTYGAVRVVSYNNLHILCYATELATEDAYNKLVLDESLDVIIDKIEELEEYAETEYDYSGYDNWGAQAVDIGGYRKFLEDNNSDREIVVVVMDTGINTSHPMFEGRLLTDAGGKIKGYSYYNSKYQYSYDNLAFDVDDPNTTDINEADKNKFSFEDDHGHGAHVAGIVTSLTPSNVKILPIKIGSHAGSSTTDIFIAAYLRIIQIYSKQYEIASVNLSFSGAGKTNEAEMNTFNTKCYEPLLNLNILPITAAGNENAKNDLEDLKAVVVSALKKQGNKYLFDNSYSNYGKIIDIAAPGSGILSAAIAKSDMGSSGMVSNNGTSMASPQVAAVAALLYLNPDLEEGFKATDIENMLYNCSVDMGESGKDEYYGHGILHLKYFETPEISGNLTFYKDGTATPSYLQYENFSTAFNFEMVCSNAEYKIIYTTDGKIPSLQNSTEYTQVLNITETTDMFIMAVKVVDGEIVGRTKLYNISYFNSLTPIEDCFTITAAGRLQNYTGNFKELVIPEKFNGTTVRELGTSLFKFANIERIVLPSTVTQMGGYVFQYCENLRYIYAPGVKKIYIAGFDSCNSLKFAVSEHPEEGATEGCYLPNITEFVGFVFSKCKNLEYVDLPTLSSLGTEGYNFQSCEKLTKANIPNVTVIGKGTFLLCSSLTGEFYLGENIQSVEETAFSQTDIKSFSVHPNNKYLTTDGAGIYSTTTFVAFATGLKNINYEILNEVEIDGVKHTITEIASLVSYGASFNYLTIPEGTTKLNGGAFSYSDINVLYYNAISCGYEGYWNPEEMGRSAVFKNVKKIVIGSQVEVVPERLFQAVTYDDVVINAKGTELATSSFYRMSEQGIVKKLILNFTDPIDSSYISMLQNAGLFYQSIEQIISKTTVPISGGGLGSLKFSTTNGEYTVYGKETFADKYAINLNYDKRGYVTPESEISYFNAGENVTYTFAPATGYKVKSIKVNGEALSGETLEDAILNGYTFSNIKDNYTLHVEFEPETYNITYKNQRGEDIEGLNPETYVYGTQVDLPVLPVGVEGEFVGWFNNAECTGDPVDSISKWSAGDKVFYTKFINETYTITVIQSANGTISDAEPSYNSGASATFTITPDVGYHIKHLLIDGVEVSAASSYTFDSITANRTISAVFEANTNTAYTVNHYQQSLTQTGATLVDEVYYKLFESENKTGTTDTNSNAVAKKYEGFTAQAFVQKVIAGDGSTVIDIYYNRNTYEVELNTATGVQSVIGSGDYLFGESVSINATLQTGYSWIRWESSDANIISDSADQNYTFTMPASSVELSAIVELIKYNISISVEGSGTVSPEGTTSLDYGESFELTVTPDTGYELRSLVINDVDETANVVNGKYVINNVNSDLTISIIFGIKTYTVNIEAAENGTITPNGEQTVNHGNDLKITFAANEGYYLNAVTVDGIKLNNVDKIALNGLILENIVSVRTVSAEFAKKKYEVIVNSDANGMVSPSGTAVVEHGEDLTLQINANVGYQLKNILVDGVDLTESVLDNQLIIEDIESDLNVEVAFEKMSFLITTSAGKNGSITESLNVDFGENVKIKFFANLGYKVKDVKVDNVSIGPVSDYMFIAVDKPHSIFVEFEILTFEVKVNINGKGNVTFDEPLTVVDYGGYVTCSITAETGWELYKVYVNGVEKNIANNNLILNNITKNINIQVIFEKEEAAVVSTNSFNPLIIILAVFGGLIAVAAALLIVVLVKHNKKMIELEKRKTKNLFTEQIVEEEPIKEEPEKPSIPQKPERPALPPRKPPKP